MKRAAFLALAVLAVALAVFTVVRRPAAVENRDDKVVQAVPLWTQEKPCRAPSEQQQQQQAAALQVLRTFDGKGYGRLHWAALEYFGGGGGIALCAPDRLLDDVAEAALAGGVFDRPFLFEAPLRLAQQL